MDGMIEALHVYDEHYNTILSHTYTGRPLPAAHLLPLYLDQQREQQQQQQQQQQHQQTLALTEAVPASLIFLSAANPPTLVFSMVHAHLLFLLTTSSELEPLLALEFLHRVADALEAFLGSPLLPAKIEANYDVVAQLLTEMCDAGTVSTTEPNALRDLVEVEGLVGKILGSITLPAALSSAAAAASTSASPKPSSMPAFSAQSYLSQKNNGPALPWRRANVRHTSNELYADVVESLSITLAPSGRPLAAFSQGSIAFTSKVSGVPDILLTLTGPSGKHGLGSVLQLPVFHPCVRLARWRERPGELSFIPPDGRFLLAAYEVDLMPAGGLLASSGTSSGHAPSLNKGLNLPVAVEIRTNLGLVGAEFEVRVTVNRSFALGAAGASSASSSSRGLGGTRHHAGTPAAPLLSDLGITVPLPADVRNLREIRPNRGDAMYNPGDRFVEWHVPSKDIAAGVAHFALRCTVVGKRRLELTGSANEEDNDEDETGAPDDYYGFDRSEFGFTEYTDHEPYQQQTSSSQTQQQKKTSSEQALLRQIAHNKILMPSSASVSFSVKGWLASGIRVESILIDTKRSRGLGDGVKPFKGVKYLTVSKDGIELRC